MFGMIMVEHLEQEQNPRDLIKVSFYLRLSNDLKEKVSCRPSSAKILRVKAMNLNQ